MSFAGSANGVDYEQEQEQQHFAYATKLAFASIVPMALHAAVELKLFEIIAKAGPGAWLSPSEIAAQLPTNQNDAPDMLDRLLYLLASNGILTCFADDKDDRGDNDDVGFSRKKRLYGLAPVAKYFVPNLDGVSLGPLLALFQDKVFIDGWYKFKDAILEGGVPFDKVHGMHAFEYSGKDPRFNQVFNKAMHNHTTIVINEIVKSYNGFKHLQHKRLVDVGGGLGINLSIITSKYPTIKGINFDLPQVLEHAPNYPAVMKVGLNYVSNSEGVQHVAGDMFESVPEGDAIFMKWILHDWADDHCLTLLKNCYKALPDTGIVIVVEGIIPEIPDTEADTSSTSCLDLHMMTQHTGGRERSKEEFLALAKRSSFSGVRFASYFSGMFVVMEFFK